jgi:glucose/arabinose dehydrogenase
MRSRRHLLLLLVLVHQWTADSQLILKKNSSCHSVIVLEKPERRIQTVDIPRASLVAPFPLQISSGETNPAYTYTDKKTGTVWLPDKYYGGSGSSSIVVADVVKTLDDPIFQRQRFGSNVRYAIPVPPGAYKVTLYMAEMSLELARARVFDIVLEGVVIQDNFDMFARVGRRRSAIFVEQNVTVTDGALDISFVPVTGIPTVAGIKVELATTPILSPVPTPPIPKAVTTFPLLINAGQSNATYSYKDAYGNMWGPDLYYAGTGTTSNVVAAVAKTTDDSIYQRQRFGNNLRYTIPVPSGKYTVRFYLAEMSVNLAGARVFAIRIEGVVVLDNVDMFSIAGRRRSAVWLTRNVTVTDGVLDISFVPVTGIPTVAGIKVDQYVHHAAPSAAPSFPSIDADTVVPTLIPSRPILINAGGPDYPAKLEGNLLELWKADNFYSNNTWTGYNAKSIRNLPTQFSGRAEIYKSWRQGPQILYDIPLAAGSYKINFFFSEPMATFENTRVFDVKVQGKVEYDDLDLFKLMGNQRRAFSFDAITAVEDGILELEFLASVGDAIVSAFQIHRLGPHLAHAVGGGPYVGVDVNKIGSALVPVDGSFSHTHGPGLVISGYSWRKGGTVLATGMKAFLKLAVGEHNVTLRVVDSGNNEAEDTFQVSVLAFGYPVLYQMSPASGNVGGGDVLMLAGVGFNFTENSTIVSFGSTLLTGPSQITVLSPTSILVLGTPASAFGVPVDVTVRTPIGLSNTQTFNYIAGVEIAFKSGEIFQPMMPTRVAFGPDGKLYVSTYSGSIYKFTLNENYQVVESVISNAIPLAYPDPNHFRPVLGIAFDPTDTKSNPDVFVSHSTIFHGSSSAFRGAAINGKVSKLSGANLDNLTDIITGLPVSDRDHAVNGILFGDYGELYIQNGGNTNAGVPGALTGSGIQPDNAIGSATLVAHLKRPNFNGTLTYNSETGALVSSSGVEIFASGERNSFGLCLHSNGKFYATDNGPNTGFGKKSISCGVAGSDPQEADKLNLITEGNFYGHANRNRGECVWRSASEPSDQGYTSPVSMLPSSTDGIIEFDSEHFGGQLRGNLIAGQFKGKLYRLALDASGENVVFGPTTLLESGGLDVIQAPDGTLVVAQLGTNKIIYHKPVDPPASSVALKSVFPRRGHIKGGTLLQLFGEKLTGTGNPTTVKVGGKLCPLVSSSATKLVCTLPPGTGLVNVTVSYWSSSSTLTNAYRYILGEQPKWAYVTTTGTIQQRHEACFVMVREKGYLMGGRGIKPVSRFDPSTKQWSDGAVPPIELHHMQCVAVDDAVFIVSSWTGNYPNEKNTANIHIYNTTSNKWSTRAGLPEPRRRGGSAQVLVVQNGKREIYVSHGNRGGHGEQAVTYGWLDKYDVDLDRWTTNLPVAPNPRDHTGGALVQNGELLCVAGGRDGGVANFFNETILPTDCYHLASGSWIVKPNIPEGRAGSAYGTTCDGKLIVAGGEGFGQAWNNVDVFDGTKWKSLNGLNTARHGSGLAISCICNEFFIASGSGAQQDTPELLTTERYLPVGSTCR